MYTTEKVPESTTDLGLGVQGLGFRIKQQTSRSSRSLFSQKASHATTDRAEERDANKRPNNLRYLTCQILRAPNKCFDRAALNGSGKASCKSSREDSCRIVALQL